MTYHLDGTVNPPYYVNIIFDGYKEAGGSRKDAWRQAITSGKEIDLDDPHLPRTAHTEKARKRIPGYIDRWSIPMVSETFRKAVEAQEPGIHQFVPFELRNGPKGDPAPEQYYFMSILRTLDAIEKDRSEIEKRKRPDGSLFSIGPKNYLQKGIFVHRSIVDGHHLWRDRYYTNGFFASDRMRASLVGHKIKGFEEQEFVEV